MDGEMERYIHKGSPQIRSQTDKQRLPLILQMPSSNRVVRCTNILNLSALKFHVPSIQFLKGSESSAAVRTAVVSQGVWTSQVRKPGIPDSGGDSRANLLFHTWIKCSLPPRETLKVTVGDLKSEDHGSPAQELRDGHGARLHPLTLPPKEALGPSVLNLGTDSSEKDRLEDCANSGRLGVSHLRPSETFLYSNNFFKNFPY